MFRFKLTTFAANTDTLVINGLPRVRRLSADPSHGSFDAAVWAQALRLKGAEAVQKGGAGNAAAVHVCLRVFIYRLSIALSKEPQTEHCIDSKVCACSICPPPNRCCFMFS